MVHIFNRIDAETKAVILSVSGDVDVAALPSLRSALDRAVSEGAAAIVLDLGEVDSIDSMGMGIVSGLGSQCERAGSSCAISVSNLDVRRYLADHGVESPLYADLSSALASFEAATQ